MLVASVNKQIMQSYCHLIVNWSYRYSLQNQSSLNFKNSHFVWDVVVTDGLSAHRSLSQWSVTDVTKESHHTAMFVLVETLQIFDFNTSLKAGITLVTLQSLAKRWLTYPQQIRYYNKISSIYVCARQCSFDVTQTMRCWVHNGYWGRIDDNAIYDKFHVNMTNFM